jgi:hypothetical protein
MFEVKAILPGAQPSHRPRPPAELHAHARPAASIRSSEPHTRPTLAAEEA